MAKIKFSRKGFSYSSNTKATTKTPFNQQVIQPHSADKINSTRGFYNKKRLARENKQALKYADKFYNQEANAKALNQKLKYATINNAITQGFGGQTAVQVTNAQAQQNAAMANNKPGVNAPDTNEKKQEADSTASMDWIK